MFNKLPKYVRIVSSCSVDKFKSQLDKHLRNIVDLPCQSGWWRLFEWRSLCGRPDCQLDATEQSQVSILSFCSVDKFKSQYRTRRYNAYIFRQFIKHSYHPERHLKLL